MGAKIIPGRRLGGSELRENENQKRMSLERVENINAQRCKLWTGMGQGVAKKREGKNEGRQWSSSRQCGAVKCRQWRQRRLVVE